MKREKNRKRFIAGKRSLSTRRKRFIAPRTANELFAKPRRSQEAWSRSTQVVTRIRTKHESLQKASREEGIAPRTVIRMASSALRKRPNGRYAARANDRLLRVLTISTDRGLEEVALRDFRQATQLAEYSNAVQTYIQTGDSAAIEKFRGKNITDANGKRVPLITDLNELNRLGSAGNFSFESLYARTS
jgi:hypothetical protein